MDKNTFKQEISDYTACGGKFAFAFGDIHLPVIYHEALNMLGVKMPVHEVFVPIDYTQGQGDRYRRPSMIVNIPDIYRMFPHHNM